MQYPTNRCRLFLFWISLSMIGMLFSACQSIVVPRIVLWHSFSTDQAAIIDAAVERFGEIFDDVIVVSSYVPPDDLIDRYKETASQGLGPDIFIASSDILVELADAGLIRTLPTGTLNPATYFTASLAPITYKDAIYGVPFAMRPLAMYYNQLVIDNPATTLSDLVTQAETGTGVAINTQFSQILWGVQSFGGKILNDDGQIVLNQGAFTNWLNWLLTANANPGMFLSRDTTTLRQLFVDGRVAYYTGTASELLDLQSLMGEDAVGVVPLPSGVNGVSGPLMQVDALMFNASSSEAGYERARDLALFLTNLEQATTFMRDLHLVPANRRVRVDLRTYPAIAGFIAQTRQTVAVPYLPQVTELLAQGDDALLRVLEGVVEPNVAADELTTRINAQFGLETTQPLTSCELSGDLELWHGLTGEPAGYLTDFVSSLNARCLSFRMNTTFVADSELVNTYIEAFTNNEAPDILLTSSASLQRLVNAASIRNIERDMMQSFSQISQATVSILGVPYGIPISLSGNVFYYNADIISDAPVTIDELLIAGSPSLSLSRSTDDMLWTLTAYNGISMRDDVVVPDLDKIMTWLDWLSRASNTEHVEVVANSFLRRTRFIAGESIYYVDSSLELAELAEAMGESLGVAQFPTGTSSSASPLVTSLALFINAKTDQTEAALAFATQITDVEEQESMVDRLRWIPANIIADQNMVADPELATIDQIMQTGIVINNHSDQILAEISRSIDTFFRGDRTVDVIAQELFDSLQEIEVRG